MVLWSFVEYTLEWFVYMLLKKHTNLSSLNMLSVIISVQHRYRVIFLFTYIKTEMKFVDCNENKVTQGGVESEFLKDLQVKFRCISINFLAYTSQLIYCSLYCAKRIQWNILVYYSNMTISETVVGAYTYYKESLLSHCLIEYTTPK